MDLELNRPRHDLGLFRKVADYQREILPDPQSLFRSHLFHSLPFNGELTNKTQTGFADDCGDYFFATFERPRDNSTLEMTIATSRTGRGSGIHTSWEEQHR
jgi:hypothetical protein